MAASLAHVFDRLEDGGAPPTRLEDHDRYDGPRCSKDRYAGFLPAFVRHDQKGEESDEEMYENYCGVFRSEGTPPWCPKHLNALCGQGQVAAVGFAREQDDMFCVRPKIAVSVSHARTRTVYTAFTEDEVWRTLTSVSCGGSMR